MIDQLIDELIQREGGYVNNPADRGGETNFGITLAVARAHKYTGAMKNLPREVAAEIYKESYWEFPHFDKVSELMPRLAEKLFDIGVNMGVGRAARFLQRALNSLNRGAKDYFDLTVDGLLGRQSFYALKMFYKKRGVDAEPVLMRLVEAEQAVKYMEIAEANPSQEAFMFGWVKNRVGDIK